MQDLIDGSDSRIDPTPQTNAQSGDLLILRNAGNIIPPHGVGTGGEAATTELAVTALDVKEVIICGPSHCGAMQGVLHLESVAFLRGVSSWISHAEITRRIIQDNYRHLGTSCQARNGFWREAKAVRGSVTREVIPSILFCGVITSVVCGVAWSMQRMFQVAFIRDISPVAFAGAVLGILFVIRLNAVMSGGGKLAVTGLASSINQAISSSVQWATGHMIQNGETTWFGGLRRFHMCPATA